MSLIKNNLAYTGDELFFQNYYYIHQHMQNIGRASNQMAMTSNDLAQKYQQKKKQVSEAVRKQYRDLYKRSIIKGKTSPEALKIITEATDKNNDQIMTQLARNVGEKLEEALAVDKMVALMKKELSLETINFSKIINEKARVNIEQFNKLLQILAQACQLINNVELGKMLAIYLLDAINTKNKITISQQEIGSSLLSQLSNFEKKVQGLPITNFDRQQIENIVSQINALGKQLSTGKTSKKGNITVAGTRQLVQNIFNTGFAEAISGQIKETSYVMIANAMNKAKLTGSDTTTIALTDEFGNYAGQSGVASYGKADVVFPNIQFNIKKEGTKENKFITMSLGISDKFYKGAKFPGIKNKKEAELYSSGSGGKLTDILKMIFGNVKRDFYLVYNTIGHGPNISEAQYALQDIILTRSIVYLFSARGGNADFAQYMFVNGQIVSIWDIILSTNNFVGKSQSIIQKQGNNNNQAVFLSLGTARGQAMAATEIDDETQRVYKVNKAINNITITAHLNLANLVKQGGQVFNRYI